MSALKSAGTAALGIPFATSGATAIASPNAIGPIQVSAPSANGYIRRTSTAKMRSRGDGSMSVTHREYIADITPETEDNNNMFQLLQSQNINPGNPLLFPWLSSIATRFESYIFRALRFIYEPQCSTGAVGTVSQVIDYDALDDPPLNKLQMMAYKGAVRSPPWFCSEFNADPKDLRKMKEYYIRNSAQQGGGDARVYDVGKFYLAYEGPADTGGAAGELYIEYMVDLKTPNLEPFAMSGTATLVGTAIEPGSLGTQTSNGPLGISIVGDTVDDAFVIGASAPGIYLLGAFAVSQSPETANTLQVSVTPGSNAEVFIQAQATSSTGSAAVVGVAQYVVYVPVFFPSTEDVVSITFPGTIVDMALSVFQVVLTPLSQETFTFPVTQVDDVLPLAMRRAVANMSRSRGLAERPPTKVAERFAFMKQYSDSKKKLKTSESSTTTVALKEPVGPCKSGQPNRKR